jgi:branched-chain amino acid transport system permease protein
MSFLAPDDFGIEASINMLVMLYLGGVGTIFGPVLGAVFVKLLPELTYKFHDYEMLTNGLILMVVLVFMRKGIFGLLARLWTPAAPPGGIQAPPAEYAQDNGR